MQFNPNALIGTLFDNKYQILSIVGSGGMGTVFKAEQTGLGRIVALKILHEGISDDESRLRFEREAQALSRVTHKHVSMFFGYGVSEQNIPYIVMEFVEGKNLHALILDKKLDWQQSVSICIQVCDAMAFCHGAQIVHRDLKPGNIILLDGNTDSAKVVDFGLSKIDSSNVQKLTQTGALLGSLPYMSPELCAGQAAGPRSDIYSLACILYECLVGEVPHQCDNPIGLLHKHRNEQVVAASIKAGKELPEGLDNAILRALAKDPEKRYQSMDEFSRDLLLVLNGQGAQIKYQDDNAARAMQNSKNQSLKIAAAISLVLLVGVGLTLQIQSSRSRKSDMPELQIKRKIPYLPKAQFDDMLHEIASLRGKHKNDESQALADQLMEKTDRKSNPVNYLRILQENYWNEMDRGHELQADKLASEIEVMTITRQTRIQAGTNVDFLDLLRISTPLYHANVAVRLKQFERTRKLLNEIVPLVDKVCKRKDPTELHVYHDQLESVRVGNTFKGGPIDINLFVDEQAIKINAVDPNPSYSVFANMVDDLNTAGQLDRISYTKNEFLKQLSSSADLNKHADLAALQTLTIAARLFKAGKQSEAIDWIDKTQKLLESKGVLSAKSIYSIIESKSSLWASYGGASRRAVDSTLADYLKNLKKVDQGSIMKVESACRYLQDLLIRNGRKEDAAKVLAATEKLFSAKESDADLLVTVYYRRCCLWSEFRETPDLASTIELENKLIKLLQILVKEEKLCGPAPEQLVHIPASVGKYLLDNSDTSEYKHFVQKMKDFVQAKKRWPQSQQLALFCSYSFLACQGQELSKTELLDLNKQFIKHIELVASNHEQIYYTTLSLPFEVLLRYEINRGCSKEGLELARNVRKFCKRNNVLPDNQDIHLLHSIIAMLEAAGEDRTKAPEIDELKAYGRKNIPDIERGLANEIVGQVFLKHNDAEAEKYFKLALKDYAKIPHILEAETTHFLLALALQRQQKNQEAETNFWEAISSLKKYRNNSMPVLKQYLEGLESLYWETGKKGLCEKLKANENNLNEIMKLAPTTKI